MKTEKMKLEVKAKGKEVPCKAKYQAVSGKILLTATLIFCILAGTGQNILYVEAATDEVEITQLSQIMVAEERVDMKAEPDINAQTLMTYEKGDSVFATGETADGWYRVTYRDKEGYIEKAALHVQEIDVEGLNAEMAANAEEGRLIVETVEKYREDARRSKIWGSVIITLVAGIFAVGIFSTTGMKKNKETGDNEEEQLKIEDLDLERE